MEIVGLMGAMPEEIQGFISLFENYEIEQIGGRVFYVGKINGIKTIVVFSRWGKVAAATTVTTLINHFNITNLIFTGVAGAINENLNIGDVVIGHRFYQHDMDARPLMSRFEIPLLGVSFFESDGGMREKAVSILNTQSLISKISNDRSIDRFDIKAPNIFVADIASGDKFFSDSNDKKNLSLALPDVVCVEMEGAAVGQVCYEHNIPFLIIRVISDKADGLAENDFSLFIKNVSEKYYLDFIKVFIG
ncbi:MAG: 5'-methylthioadenosine/adenosylhomocysteine nucleosidase [Bacteroidota bacterium]|jgi:adenosylhomocysteine nucleosidase